MFHHVSYERLSNGPASHEAPSRGCSGYPLSGKPPGAHNWGAGPKAFGDLQDSTRSLAAGDRFSGRTTSARPPPARDRRGPSIFFLCRRPVPRAAISSGSWTRPRRCEGRGYPSRFSSRYARSLNTVEGSAHQPTGGRLQRSRPNRQSPGSACAAVFWSAFGSMREVRVPTRSRSIAASPENDAFPGGQHERVVQKGQTARFFSEVDEAFPIGSHVLAVSPPGLPRSWGHRRPQTGTRARDQPVTSLPRETFCPP